MNTSIFKLATNTLDQQTRVVHASGALVHEAVIRALWLTLVSLVLIGFGAVSIAQAQVQGRTYSRTEVERFMRDVEQSSREFERDFDAWLDRSPLDGQAREDQYNREVRNLTSALTTLRSNFDRRNDWWLARNDMVRVLNSASSVNSLLANREARGGLNRQWNRLRRNIDRLADAFDLPAVGANYSGIQPTFPDFGNNARACSLTGVFRGYTNTGEAELSIGSNGTATIRSLYNNAFYNGRCVNDVLYFDWGAFNLVRAGRNLRTVEIGNTGNTTTYRRVSGNVSENFPTNPSYPTYPNNPNNPNYPTYPGQVGNVPDWALGTFRGQTDSGESELTINADGSATIRSLYNNSFHYGRLANDTLTFDWGTFRITRDGNGIRTVELNNRGNRTSYRRVN